MRRVLYLEHAIDGTIGGSHVCLLDICRLINREKFRAVAWFYEGNALLPEFRNAGADVVVSRPPGPIALSRTAPLLPTAISSPIQSVGNFLRVAVVNVFWWLRRLRKWRIDIVHLNNNSFSDIDLQLAARILRIPVVAHQRGFPKPPGRLGFCLANAQRGIFAISAAIRDHLIHQGIAGKLVHLVHDGIDPRRFQSSTSAARTESRQEKRLAVRAIGIVGNVKPWKGQAIVVQAMSRISAIFPDVECWIVGAEADKDYASELRQLARSLGLASRVKFLGFRSDSWRLMQEMAVVIHASLSPEPFGIVILEAMHQARPVVASAHGGPLEIVIDGQTGFLTAPGDVEQLASRVITLLADPELGASMGQRGRERYLKFFTAQKTVEAIEAVYSEIGPA